MGTPRCAKAGSLVLPILQAPNSDQTSLSIKRRERSKIFKPPLKKAYGQDCDGTLDHGLQLAVAAVCLLPESKIKWTIQASMDSVYTLPKAIMFLAPMKCPLRTSPKI